MTVPPSVQRTLRRLPLFFLLIALPLGASAASVDKMLPASASAAVTRGEFLRAAVAALDLPLKDEGPLPFKTVPPLLHDPSRTADEFGALDIFGTELSAEKAITRGEASYVLARLMRLTPPAKGIVQYGDAKGELNGYVNLAAEQKWLKPLRKSTFGAAKALTSREAKAMLRLVAAPETEKPVAPVTVKLKTKQKAPVPRDEMLRTVWQLLNDEYLYTEKIDDDEAAYAAAEALVESLKDPYTTFMRPANAKAFNTQLGGEVTGIGAQVEFKNQQLIIVAPMKGSPSEKAGLKPGDIVLSVNGEPLAGLDFNESVEKVRGPKGSLAKLRIVRDGTEMDVEVTRDTIKIPEVVIRWEGNVAVVEILQFGAITDRELRTMMIAVQEKHPVGIIVDLRNNPGGYLHAADVVAGIFLPKGSTVATILSRDAEYLESTSEDPVIPASTPLAVLVNKGSASASEIVAGALQDAKRATVVGETTFGKGTVQQIMEFADGSSLKLTVAEWQTPKRRKIDGLGVTPDIVVEQSETGDAQLQRALEEVR